MTNMIAIRKRVAALCGFTELHLYPFAGVDIWKGSKDGKIHTIPKYELSLDAITQAFDDHKLTFTLQKGIADNGNIGYFVSNSKGKKYSDTAAKAMCYLFIYCMEGKS